MCETKGNSHLIASKVFLACHAWEIAFATSKRIRARGATFRIRADKVRSLTCNRPNHKVTWQQKVPHRAYWVQELRPASTNPSSKQPFRKNYKFEWWWDRESFLTRSRTCNWKFRPMGRHSQQSWKWKQHDVEVRRSNSQGQQATRLAEGSVVSQQRDQQSTGLIRRHGSPCLFLTLLKLLLKMQLNNGLTILKFFFEKENRQCLKHVWILFEPQRLQINNVWTKKTIICCVTLEYKSKLQH